MLLCGTQYFSLIYCFYLCTWCIPDIFQGVYFVVDVSIHSMFHDAFLIVHLVHMKYPWYSLGCSRGIHEIFHDVFHCLHGAMIFLFLFFLYYMDF